MLILLLSLAGACVSCAVILRDCGRGLPGIKRNVRHDEALRQNAAHAQPLQNVGEELAGLFENFSVRT